MPRTCDECAEWHADPARNWDRTKRCAPCFRSRYSEFAHRMRALWCYVGHGEAIDSEGTVQWSIDWQALDMAFKVQHPLTCEEYADEIFDAMIAVRNHLNSTRRNPSLSALAAAHPSASNG